MIEFAADFETSKIIKYLPVPPSLIDKDFDEEGNYLKPRAVYRYNEEKGILEPSIYRYRKVDVENSKTWVYHFGIEKLDLTDFYEGYSIDEFMEYIKKYPLDMKIWFHNEKFDGSFILFYMIKRPKEFKQLLELKNIDMLKDLYKKYNIPISASFMEPFFNRKKVNIEKYDPLKSFSKYGLIKTKNKEKICQVDGIFFTESVNSLGVMYSIKIFYFEKDKPLHTVEIVDSLKLLNFSIRALGKDFLNEELPKLKIDYDKIRPEKRPDLLTKEDHEYLKRDIDIAARCLTILKTSKDIEGSYDKSTIASLALDDWKTIWAKKMLKKEIVTISEKEDCFRKTFPVFKTEIEKGEYINEYDTFIRAAYKGGFCYAYKINKTTDDPKGINYPMFDNKGMCVLDVNSLFPFCMLTKPMPYGMPITVKNKPLEREGWIDIQHIDGKEIKTLYDYYFVHCKVNFELKKDHIPSIMLKGRDIDRNWPTALPQNEYLESTDDETIELILTKDDFELMIEQYDFYKEKEGKIVKIDPSEIEIIETYYFQTAIGIFTDYIEKWARIKIEASKPPKNKSRRALAKLFLNSLYGKFGSKVRNRFKFFFIDAKNKLNSEAKIENIDEPLYTPVAAAITAAGRRYTIETSQKILSYGLEKYNRYVYCYSDTDSIHTILCRDDVIDCLGDIVDINETGEFGLWDIEEDNIIKSKFIRTKTYMEERREPNDDGELMKTGVAGLPSEIQKCLTWDSFENGVTIIGKLSPIQVEGGTALVESTFEIKN